MRRRTAILIAAFTIAALSIVPGVAQAIPTRAPWARVIPIITTQADREVGILRAVYSCSEGEHLWVSAKQATSRAKDPALKEEGSGGTAAGWLHSHRNSLTCDGRPHLGSFTIDKVEWGQGSLQPGWAWVQFCLTLDDGSPEGVLLINESLWARVL